MDPISASNRFGHKNDKHAPEAKKQTQKIAEVGEQAIPKIGLAKRMLLRGGFYAAGKIVKGGLEKKEQAAKEYLQDHVRGLEVITNGLPKELDVIIQFLQQTGLPLNQDKQPGDGASKDKMLINSIVWIALGNVAKKVTKENETISLEEFTYRATQFFVPFIGDRLNRIDEKIAAGDPCNAATFTPFVKDLFDSVLQLEGKMEKMGLKVLQGVLAGLIAEQYQQTKTLIQTGVSVPGKDKTVILPLLKKVSTYFATVVSGESIKEDEKKLTEITRHPIAVVHQFLAPVTKYMEPLVTSLIADSLKDYLPEDPELIGKLTSAIANKLLLNLVQSYQQNHPGEPVRLELIAFDFQKRCKDAFQGDEQELHHFSDFILRSLVLNDVPFLTGFYGRYQENAQTLVESFLAPLFNLAKSGDQMVADAKLVLEKKVKTNPALIGVVEQMIGKMVGIGSGFVIPYNSKENLFAASKVVNDAFKGPLEKVMSAFSWKIFVRLIPTPPDGKVFQAEELLPSIVDNFVQFFNGYFPDLIETVNRDWKGLSVEERKAQALKLNEPILKAFLKQFISDDLAAEIPLPEKYRQIVVEKIETALNDLVSDGLVASCGWMLEKQENEEALNRMFKSNNNRPNQPSAPVKACHAAGKIIESALPYQCREKGNEWSQSVFDMLKNALPEGEPSQQIASAGMKMVSSLFAYVGTAQSTEVKDMLSFVSSYAETALLKLTRQLGERVELLERTLADGDSSAIEKILVMLTKELEPHLRVYGENRKLFRKDDKKKILDGSRSEVLTHSGMGDEDKQNVDFKAMSSKILALAELHAGSQLPVPALFRDAAWKKLHDTLLPSMLLTISLKMKEPRVMDQLIRFVLERFSPDITKDKIDIREAFFPRGTADYKIKNKQKVRQFDDPYQLELEKEIEKLGLVILGLRSPPLIGSLMRMKWASKHLGEVFSQVLRAHLREPANKPNVLGKALTLNEVLGASLDAFVDHFVPCERVDSKWQYFALGDEGVTKDKKLNEPDFSELFPANQEEEERLESRGVIRRVILGRKIIKATGLRVSDQLDKHIKDLVKAPWDNFVNGFVKVMRSIALSKHKEKIADGLRNFFRGFGGYLGFFVLALISFPLWLTLSKVTNAVLTQKGEKYIQGLSVK